MKKMFLGVQNKTPSSFRSKSNKNQKLVESINLDTSQVLDASMISLGPVSASLPHETGMWPRVWTRAFVLCSPCAVLV